MEVCYEKNLHRKKFGLGHATSGTGSKQALGGDMSFDRFVLIPAAIFKTDIRLAEYKTFFEPQLDDMALSRNIQMGIRDIESRVQLIVKDKDAVIGAIQTQTQTESI